MLTRALLGVDALGPNLIEAENTTALKDWIQRCAKRKVALGVQDCQNLAPAGTGTGTLTHTLEHLSAWTHHCHAKGAHNATIVGGYQCCGCSPDCCDVPKNRNASTDQTPPLRTPSAPCYVMTIRDPPSRLASGLSFDYIRRTARPQGHRFMNGRNYTPAASRALMHTLAEALDKDLTRHRAESVIHGAFLVPQVEYLRAIDCSRDELHLLCTERLTRGWEQFLATFESAAASRPVLDLGNVNQRRPYADGDPAHNELFAAADGERLRNHFRTDYLLWKAACASVRYR